MEEENEDQQQFFVRKLDGPETTARNDALVLQKGFANGLWIPLEQRRTADQSQNKRLEDIDAWETLGYISSPPQIQELPVHYSCM